MVGYVFRPPKEETMSKLAPNLFCFALVSAFPLSAQKVSPTPPGDQCSTYGYTVYDMVSWIVQTYPNASSTYLGQVNNPLGPISDFSKWYPASKRFYRVSHINGYANEVFDYDDNYIYIRRETMYSSPADFLYHDQNYVWAPRFALTANTPQHQACGNTSTTNHYQQYSNCLNVGSGGTNFLVAISGPFTLALGGDVGTVQALLKNLTNLSNFEVEKYWYAEPYGFVKFQKIDANGQILVEEIHNTIYQNDPPLSLSCGIGY